MERRGELLSPSLGEYRPPIAIGSRAGVDQLKAWLCLLRLKPLWLGDKKDFIFPKTSQRKGMQWGEAEKMPRRGGKGIPETETCPVHCASWVAAPLWWTAVKMREQQASPEDQEAVATNTQNPSATVWEPNPESGGPVGTQGGPWRTWAHSAYSLFTLHPHLGTSLLLGLQSQPLSWTPGPWSSCPSDP